MKSTCKILENVIQFASVVKKEEKAQMKKLYGSIEISKILKEGGKSIKEHINYYKLKNEKYGFEIVKRNDLKENIEITNINNITENEKKINNILDILVAKEIMPESEDIIEDLVKQYI